MAGSPSTYENIKEIPLVVSFNPRDYTITADAYAKNIFVEKDEDGPFSVKRPGLGFVQDFSLPAYGLTTYTFGGMASSGQSGGLFMLIGDHLFSTSSGSGISPYGSLLPLGAVAGDIYRCIWTPFLNTLPAFLAMQGFSGNQVYTYGRLGNGLEAFNAQNSYAVQSQLLSSLCLLDNTWYVLDGESRISASALGDISTWPALSYVVVDPQIGNATCMFRLVNYLWAFGDTGHAAYYDAGISPGAPIAIVPNSVSGIGISIASAVTPAVLDDTAYFLGVQKNPSYAVYAMTGSTISRVSTPGVERVLTFYAQQADHWYPSYRLPTMPRGMIFNSGGHTYYVLTFPTFTYAGTTYKGITLAYCTDSGAWLQWTQVVNGVEAEWRPGGIQYDYQGNLLAPDINNGKLYNLQPTIYQDNGQPINVLIQTDLYNWGNQRTKLIAATYPLLDTVNTYVSLSWTDNDYQSFCTPQVINTSTAKKQLVRCGSTVQRAWLLTHADNTPMRFYQLEVEVIPGAL